MSQPITIKSVNQVLLDRSIRTGIKYPLTEAEALLGPVIELIGVDQEKKTYLDNLAREQEEYPIDAEDTMKALEIVNQTANSKDIGRALVSAKIIPKLDLKELVKQAKTAAAVLAQNASLTLFTNHKCQVIRVSNIVDGQTRHSYRYKLTIIATHKVLMRAHNEDAYSEYFSIQIQLNVRYRMYQSDYESYLKDISLQQKDEAIARFEQMMIAQGNQITILGGQITTLVAFGEKAAADNEVLLSELTDVKHELIDTKSELVNTNEILFETKECVATVAKHLEEKSFKSTQDPIDDQLRHHALVMKKKMGNTRIFKLSSGQSGYIDQCRRELLDQEYEVHIDKFYQANGIDYRRNVQSSVQTLIDDTLAPFNAPIFARREELKREIEETDAMLAEDIAEWNANLAERVRKHNLTATQRVKLSSNGRRYYYGRTTYAYLRSFNNERRSYAKEVSQSCYKLITVPIKVCATVITWLPNKYVKLSAIKRIIDEVNKQTQASPYQSPTGSDHED